MAGVYLGVSGTYGKVGQERAARDLTLIPRNISAEDGSFSCSAEQQRCDALVNLTP